MEEAQDSSDLADHPPELDSAEPELFESTGDSNEDGDESQGPTQQVALDAEYQKWDAMPSDDRRAALRQVITGVRSPMPETLMRLCCRAKDAGDRPMLTLAFEALSKRVTRLLLSQAWGVLKDEKIDHVQEVLIKIFEAIQTGKAEFACRCFAAFTRRRAIELYRARKSTWEGSNQREDPSETDDPLDHQPSRASGPEFRALMNIALEKLPPKHAEAFAQYHHFGLLQAEIATHHNVSDRTVRTWLNKAAEALGLSGDEYGL